jgi:NodT family efflux transporter outer membrane factor (OMF) lipoprotein
MKAKLFLIALLLALTGCAVGPNYKRPEPAATASGVFVEGQATPRVTGSPVADTWWKLFDDPVLDTLIERALARNTDIRVATANLAKARAVVGEARNRLLPTTQANAQYSRIRSNGQGATQGGQIQSGEFDYFALGFDAGYEVDLFGGVARSIEAARGDASASKAALDAARIAVVAETARTYAQLCSFAEQGMVADETLSFQRRTLDLTQKQFEAGRGTRRDIALATVLTEQLAALVPQLDAERRASLYALATLTGDTPTQADATAAQCRKPPIVKSVIPVGDGAALLKRRPDVARAEQVLAADTARIGVATAELYPSITLLGSVGLGSTSLKTLTDSSSRSFSLGPLISWTIPNIGAARSKIAQAKAQMQASLATFDGTVLTALQEIEQALARYAGAIAQQAALQRAEAASAQAARLTQARYDYGADSFLDLLDAQRAQANARAALAQANGNLAEAQVSLFKALGGGWESADAMGQP